MLNCSLAGWLFDERLSNRLFLMSADLTFLKDDRFKAMLYRASHGLCILASPDDLDVPCLLCFELEVLGGLLKAQLSSHLTTARHLVLVLERVELPHCRMAISGVVRNRPISHHLSGDLRLSYCV